MGFQLLVLQHTDRQGPGHLLLSAAERLSLNLHIVHCWQHAIPDPGTYDGLIILGGLPNMDEETTYPFLREEKFFIKTWLSLNRPCLGFRLGCQLIAHSLHAEIKPNFTPSIGFIEGHLTSEGKHHPVFRNLTGPLTLFKWHGHALMPPLPGQISILATSRDCMVEAFSLKNRPHIIGVQFDNQAAHPENVKMRVQYNDPWRISYRKELYDNEHLINQSSLFYHTIREEFFTFFTNFIAMFPAPTDKTAAP